MSLVFRWIQQGSPLKCREVWTGHSNREKNSVRCMKLCDVCLLDGLILLCEILLCFFENFGI